MYEDLARPPLSERALRRALLGEESPWTQLSVVGRTGSTNADLVAAARQGAPAGTVLVAEEQHEARGRLDRAWLSPPQAGLTFSMLLRPAAPQRRWGWLQLLAGVALVSVVRRLGEVPAALKWPNDLLVGPEQHKAAGLLAEAAGGGVVLGVGLNVSTRRAELPRADATSLVLAGSACTDRATLLAAVLREIGAFYRLWDDCGGDPVRSGLEQAYGRAGATVGRDVRVELPGDRVVEGRATGVDGDGCLVVRTADGSSASYAAGDVVHLR